MAAHLFLGAFPLTLGVNIIALANLVTSLVIIANISSIEPFYFANFEVAPFTQLLVGTWAAIGIPISIFGGVGAVYRIEYHLNVYMYYLVVSVVIEVLLFFRVAFAGDMCGVHRQYQTDGVMGNSLVCALSMFSFLILLLLGIAVTAYFVFVVNTAKKYIHTRGETDLLRYQEPWQRAAAMASSAMEAEARRSPANAPVLLEKAAVPVPVYSDPRLGVAAAYNPAVYTAPM